MLFETAKHVDWNCSHMYMFLLVKYLIFLLYIAVIDLITFLQSQIIFFSFIAQYWYLENLQKWHVDLKGLAALDTEQ